MFMIDPQTPEPEDWTYALLLTANREGTFPHPALPRPDCKSRDTPRSCEDILASVALVEAALAHILNAEGEKLQRAVADAENLCELLQFNESVQRTICLVIRLEERLLAKLEAARRICCCCPCPEKKPPCCKKCPKDHKGQ